jgi:aminoglycoside/choline kinase family phosphotransferase
MGRDDQFMESRIRLISQYRNQSYYNDMMDDRSFYRAFAKNGLQRCLKALGNFARNRKVYEAYIPLSLRSLKHTMALLAEYDARSADKVSELRTLLSPLFSQAP